MWIDEIDEVAVLAQDEVELSYYRERSCLERLCRRWLSWVPWSGRLFDALWGPTWVSLDSSMDSNGMAVFDPPKDWAASSEGGVEAHWIRMRLPVTYEE